MYGKSQELVNAAKFIYGDRREQVKKDTIKDILEPYQKLHNKSNLLGAAIDLCQGKDEKHLLLFLGVALDEIGITA